MAKYLISILLLLFACSPAHRATKKYNRAKAIDLATVAALSQQDWPCGVSSVDTQYLPGRIDTLDVPQYLDVPCPDEQGNTVPIKVKVPCKCATHTPDTLLVERQIKDPRDSIYIGVLKNKITESAEGGKGWRTAALLLSALLLVVIIFLIIKK